MKNLITLALLLTSITAFCAGEIRGKIIGPDGLGAPGVNVYVMVSGQMAGTLTDMDGKFIIKPLDAGIYDVFIKAMGFADQGINNVTVGNDRITYVEDVTLSGNEMDEFKFIEHRTKLIDAEKTSLITMLPAQVKKDPNRMNLKTMIARNNPGIMQKDEGQPLYFRGSRAGAVQYLVDGMKGFDGDENVPSIAYGEIMVYTGGLPAKYGDVLGGVIVVETKSYFSLLNEHGR